MKPIFIVIVVVSGGGRQVGSTYRSFFSSYLPYVPWNSSCVGFHFDLLYKSKIFVFFFTFSPLAVSVEIKDLRSKYLVKTELGHVTVIFWLSGAQSVHMLWVTSITAHDER